MPKVNWLVVELRACFVKLVGGLLSDLVVVPIHVCPVDVLCEVRCLLLFPMLVPYVNPFCFSMAPLFGYASAAKHARGDGYSAPMYPLKFRRPYPINNAIVDGSLVRCWS